jgi:small conductance mechanosensitive channel
LDDQKLQLVIEGVATILATYGLSVLGAIAILLLGRIVAGPIAGIVRRTLTRANVEESLIGFAETLVRTAIFAFSVIAALQKFGVETTSFVAVIGAAGLAVGLALQGTLSNFASGVLILLFRPFRVGDFVVAGGASGSVKEIGIIATTMFTPDNQKVIIPNSQIMGSTITNVTANDTRRIDLVAGIGYGDDMKKAARILQGLLDSHPKVLKDPAPIVRVNELADSSVNLIVRPWVNTSDYWAVRWELTERIKEEFDANGISIPFPQRDVHLYSTEPKQPTV